ncbi:mitochondrial import receptor subunit tom20 [Saitoella coloradoensis]
MSALRNTAIAAGTVAALALGYAVYFDYRRRNDAAFRKTLRSSHKKVAKAKKAEEEQAIKKSTEALTEALAQVYAEGLPTGVEERESFFMEQVTKGEILFTQGEEHFLNAAVCFYKAWKVYPQPVELLNIYQQTMPEGVFNIVVAMAAIESRTHADTAATAEDAGIDEDVPNPTATEASEASPADVEAVKAEVESEDDDDEEEVVVETIPAAAEATEEEPLE